MTNNSTLIKYGFVLLLSSIAYPTYAHQALQSTVVPSQNMTSKIAQSTVNIRLG